MLAQNLLKVINKTPMFSDNKVPLSLIYFINNECNARCSHCFIYYDEEIIKNNPRYQLGNLKIDEIEKITKSFDKKLAAVYLTGGEPFLRPDIEQIVDLFIENAGVDFVSITSNGFLVKLMDEKVTRICNKYPNKNFYLSMSLDFYGEKHDINRKLKNSFEKVMEIYKILKAKNFKNLTVNINTTVFNQTNEELLEMYNYLIKEGVDSITVAAVRDDPEESGAVKFNKEGYIMLMNLIEKDMKNKKLKSFEHFAGADFMNAKNIAIRKRVLDEVENKKFITPCRAGSALGVLHANGIVYPCEILDKPIGNIKDFDYDFTKLWKSQTADDVRKFIIKTDCHCSYECAWSQNIFVEPRNWPLLMTEYVRLKLHKIVA